MSLWTPGGEVPVNRERSDQPDQSQPSRSEPDHLPEDMAEMAGLSLEDLTPEQREQAEAMLAQMAEAQRQIAGTPAEQIVATHAAGLYELAAIKLQQPEPMLDEAKLAIDALAALIEGVGDQLGPDGPPRRDALRNIQIAFVQIKERFAS